MGKTQNNDEWVYVPQKGVRIPGDIRISKIGVSLSAQFRERAQNQLGKEVKYVKIGVKSGKLFVVPLTEYEYGALRIQDENGRVAGRKLVQELTIRGFPPGGYALRYEDNLFVTEGE